MVERLPVKQDACWFESSPGSHHPSPRPLPNLNVFDMVILNKNLSRRETLISLSYYYSMVLNAKLTTKQRQMIENQLQGRDITDERVLQAFRKVPREEFVGSEMREFAYDDNPLPIGHNQTISQPYIVAKMCQLLELTGSEKVLDVGTGSGFQAAILSLLCKEVIAIERLAPLAEKASEKLKQLGFDNVKVVVGDGAKGVQDESPFDAIKCAAATSEVPFSWIEQLKEGGRIVLPLQKTWYQELTRITKIKGKLQEESFGSVVFVPLIT